MKKYIAWLLLTVMTLLFPFALAEDDTAALVVPQEILAEDGYVLADDYEIEYGNRYSDPTEVAIYLYVFQELPENYITKAEAQELGWESRLGNLWDVAYGYSIGGDRFGNREGLLPKADGRTWTECDVNYYGGYRGSERILYSTDGLIYYTNDHYQTFTELYDGWYEAEEDAQ